MKRLVWDERFSTGVPAMDRQHQELFSMINDLLRAGRLQARSETVSELLTRMREYASTHFASEEPWNPGGIESVKRYESQRPPSDSLRPAFDSSSRNSTPTGYLSRNRQCGFSTH